MLPLNLKLSVKRLNISFFKSQFRRKKWIKHDRRIFFFQVEFFFFFAHLLQLPRKTSFQRWHIWVVFKLRCQYFKNKKSQRPGALKVFRLPFIHRKRKWVILKPRNYSQHVKCCPHLTCAVYASTVMCNYFFIKKYCWSSVITFLILIMTALKPNCHITQNEVLAHNPSCCNPLCAVNYTDSRETEGKFCTSVNTAA